MRTCIAASQPRCDFLLSASAFHVDRLMSRMLLYMNLYRSCMTRVSHFTLANDCFAGAALAAAAKRVTQTGLAAVNYPVKALNA